MGKITKKVVLNQNSINDCIKSLGDLIRELQVVSRDIPKVLAQETAKEVAKNYAKSDYIDGSHDKTINVNVGNGNASVVVSGTQVIYDEFGTGTMGANNSHPIKSEFDLNPYNSGKTIRANRGFDKHGFKSKASKEGIPVNGLYWTFKKGDTKYYTQGVPAGCQVYNASLFLRENKTRLIKEMIGDVLSKV